MPTKMKKINSTTFEAKTERATVVIGDKTSEHFIPAAKIYNFEEETSFEVKYSDRPFFMIVPEDQKEAEEFDLITLTEGFVAQNWEPNKEYKIGEIVEWEQIFYKILQTHTSLEIYPPPIVPAIYAEYTPPGIVTEWKQPLGAGYEFDLGAIVSHEGIIWESIIEKNVWEPGVYGWIETDGRVDVDCYFIEEYGEQKVGAFEFEIVLRDKPTSNVVTMQVEMDGLVAYYQPEPTQEEINEGVFRPENVIGSYAVYKENFNAIHDIENSYKYQIGKAFHVYRPKIVDAEGNWIWGELSLDNNILSITIDSDWLSSAIYPVRVDPTFGYEEEGGSWYLNDSEHFIVGSWFESEEEGLSSRIYGYINNSLTTQMRGVIYNYMEDLGSSGWNTASGSVYVDSGLDWKEKTLSSGQFVFSKNEKVWLSFLIEKQEDESTNQIAFDVGPDNSGFLEIRDAFSFPSSLTGVTSQNRIYSIYLSYTKPEYNIFGFTQTSASSSAAGTQSVRVQGPFSPLQDGIAEKISYRLQAYAVDEGAFVNFKYGLYDSQGNFLSETEETAISSGESLALNWYTKTLLNPVNVYTSEEYYIAIKQKINVSGFNQLSLQTVAKPGAMYHATIDSNYDSDWPTITVPTTQANDWAFSCIVYYTTIPDPTTPSEHIRITNEGDLYGLELVEQDGVFRITPTQIIVDEFIEVDSLE